MTEFITVYDLAQSSAVNTRDLLVFAEFIAILLTLALLRPSRRKGAIFAGAVACALMLFASCYQYLQYHSMFDRLQRGAYVKVDGTIMDFVPGDPAGHAPESFSVDGHRYSYWSSKDAPGFRMVQGRNGFLHNGVHVRIADINGAIARLEVAR
ncbi:MAG TPA: hypothetical protein VJV22_16455 [Acidobacteriaceae bacterium]|nr:hypothetical protein [Acidobacteriaceae bacterium]